MTENERCGLVFAKTGPINSGTAVKINEFSRSFEENVIMIEEKI